MRCPTLAELPPPPPGKSGWPWTIESPQLTDCTPDKRQWKKISIITPSYNQGQFIEETIRSVLLQGYSNLEYFIMDGGSTDESIAVIKKYEPWLTSWVSERDDGQTDAINKGLNLASGSIRGYLNSDDLLMPDALKQVADEVSKSSTLNMIISGDCLMGYDLDKVFDINRPILPVNYVDAISRDGICPQPATFWTDLSEKSNLRMNESLRFVMDYDFWCKLTKHGYIWKKIDQPLAFYRHHDLAKGATLTNVMWSELAGLPILYSTLLDSLDEKVEVWKISRRRYRHFLRLEIESILYNNKFSVALKYLFIAVKADPGILVERSTLGLFKKILKAAMRISI